MQYYATVSEEGADLGIRDIMQTFFLLDIVT